MATQATPVLPDLHTVFGFGVAGNFAGHLEQAGEAADFATVQSPAHEAPKGIFPWFVPGAGDREVPVGADVVPGFLHAFPLSPDEIARPPGADVNLQIEPEVGLLARVDYDPSTGDVVGLRPEAIGAFNDCSIRRAGAEKISHKKNWGEASKGLAPLLLAIDDLSPQGPTVGLRLACFLRRDGALHAYGIDSALEAYSYYGQQLLDWLVDRLRHQTGSAETPLEPVGAYLRAAGNPPVVLIGIGATRYTPLGQQTFLEVGDESIVVIYDGTLATPDALATLVSEDRLDELSVPVSVLRQRVVAGQPAPAF